MSFSFCFSCHLALGEPQNAAGLLSECLKRSQSCGAYPDSKLEQEAREGLQKVKVVEDAMEKGRGLIWGGGASGPDAAAALPIIEEALKVAAYSEQLLELKSWALLAVSCGEGGWGWAVLLAFLGLLFVFFIWFGRS